MHHLSLLQDLAIIMIIAGLVTILFHRFKQPVVLGYIAAGLIIGPYTPPFMLIQDEHTIKTLAEFGVIMLMFSIGQHFQLSKLLKVGPTAFIAASLEIIVMVWVGYQLGQWFGWGTMDSLFLGAILSISSTTIIIKALQDLNLTKERFATLIFGILIIEDILAIAMLALLSSIAVTGSLQLGELLGMVGRLVVFLALVIIIGLLIVPKSLRYISQYRNNEMLLIATLGICFGVSLLAAWLGYSVALGAFLAGVLVAESRENAKIGIIIEPVRDMFSAVFFVSIGMLIDPALLVKYAVPIFIITIAVVVGKIITCSIGAFLAGNDTRTSLRIGMGVSQIGEFSFIIAQLGLTLSVTSDFLYPIAVMVSVITTLLTPYLIKNSDDVVVFLEKRVSPSILSFLNMYHQWANHLSPSKNTADKAIIREVLFKMAFPIILNILVIASLFIGASTLNKYRWLVLSDNEMVQNTILWAIVMFLSLPIVLHTIFKFKALAMALAELSTAHLNIHQQQQSHIQAVFTTTIFIAGVGALSVWMIVLSLTILPPWWAVLVVFLLLAWWVHMMWKRFNTLYSRLHLTIRDNLSRQMSEDKQEPVPPKTLLQTAQLACVTLPASSPVVKRLIREVALRSKTGASIVGIGRGEQHLINPEPDEELQTGDTVLLLGTSAHLETARQILLGEKTIEMGAELKPL
ncbi:Kef-type K+ transport system, membrane component [Beggiatoa alba B18LD]|uniref:Kef-type K+ transport system, membrane component n=1 Tax=Beggiatoa alba B18LD TaxID=395493 RepID=I3CFY2_9GAMM|nr:cation:proton antiporter [Beggiatoa alba]EIJ42525.1 Kef-type K+ transport system, membrane component [Beggiatoa alba B18LD]